MKTIETTITLEEFIYETEVMLKDLFVGKIVKESNNLYVIFDDNTKFCLHIEKVRK